MIGVVIANTAFSLLVTVKSALLARFALRILMVSAAELVTDGLPLTVIFAWVLSVRLTLWLKPLGRLVIQLPESMDANLSFVSLIVTSWLVIRLSFTPSMVTSSTVAVGTGAAV